MTSVRRDIFTGAYVIVSELRGERPVRAASAVFGDIPASHCPFCPGNEDLTPRPLGDEGKDWQTRWFPNKYPALLGEGCPPAAYGLYGGCPGTGSHEILVDTREHNGSLSDFPLSHTENVLLTLQSRYELYRGQNEVKQIQIFKNNGARAGATQNHSHWQLIAGGFVPSLQETILKRLSEHKTERGKCLYCDVLENELSDGQRVVSESGRFAVIAPYASRLTYETWIVPKRHVSCFSELSGPDIAELSGLLPRMLSALRAITKNSDYNILLMDSPQTEGSGLFHWHIQILPRLGGLAGYEYSTGSYINHITPEKAAEAFRRALGSLRNQKPFAGGE